MTESSAGAGAETGAASKVAGPPVVYLPVQLDDEGSVTDIRLVALDDGRKALLGYTALDRFVHCCGAEQPWMLFDTSELDELRSTVGFDVNYLDLPLPGHLRVPPVPDESRP